MALTFSVAVAHTNSQANAEHKLQFLSAEYAKGAELEQVANEKKAMLEAQLQEAGRVLGADVVRRPRRASSTRESRAWMRIRPGRRYLRAPSPRLTRPTRHAAATPRTTAHAHSRGRSFMHARPCVSIHLPASFA